MGFVAEDASWLVLGSNGALPRTPAWIFNIRSQPHVSVQLGRRRFAADASILDGPERASAWALVCDRYPFFTAYQAAITRQIEVVRLSEQRLEAIRRTV